ncbi:phosphoesterase, partial [Halorubrum sp. Eb13]
ALSGSDVQDMEGLEGQEFDDDTRKMLGLDDIDEILGQIEESAEMDVEELEKEAEAVKAGGAGADIKSADEVIQEMDEEPVDEEVERET